MVGREATIAGDIFFSRLRGTLSSAGRVFVRRLKLLSALLVRVRIISTVRSK